MEETQESELDYDGLPDSKKMVAPTDRKIVELFMEYSQALGSATSAAHRITAETGIPAKRIKSILQKAYLIKEAKKVQSEVATAIIKDKVPMVSGIVELTLTTIQGFLEDLSKDEVRKSELTVKDIKDLADVATKFNEMVRLEQGKSTANIGVSVQQTITLSSTMQALAKLKMIDPVFEYPELPSSEESDARD